ncbi:MAG: dihydrofolate reductase [Patescibacteria group bacterium]
MITLVAAVAKNGCIGKGGELPWRIPEDVQRFKDLTTGSIVVMGRKTWESIPEKFRPLPNRHNAVVTRQADYKLPDGVDRFSSLDAALDAFATNTVMVIGGAEIYTQSIGRAQTLQITEVHRDVEGDTFFPKIDPAIWKETFREDHDEYSFVTYSHV